MKAITYNDANLEVELVEPLESSLLLEWHLDNMDRGDQDYETSAHSRLVVDPNDKDVKRGDVIYFKSPVFTIDSNPNFNMPKTPFLIQLTGQVTSRRINAHLCGIY